MTERAADAGVRGPFEGVRALWGVRSNDQRGSSRKLLVGAEGLWKPRSVPDVLSVHNRVAGTIRGFHLQEAPYSEAKALWVSAGSIFDVILDLRSDLPTFGQWQAFHMTAEDPFLLILPLGVAHGYQTLSDNTVVTYLIDGTYQPLAARAVLATSPSLGIPWPLKIAAISEADKGAAPWTLC